MKIERFEDSTLGDGEIAIIDQVCLNMPFLITIYVYMSNYLTCIVIFLNFSTSVRVLATFLAHMFRRSAIVSRKTGKF